MASTSPLVLSMASSAPCAPESCSSEARRAPPSGGRGQVDVDDVAGLDQRVAVAHAGPLPVGGQQHDLRAWLAGRTDARVNFQRKHARDQRVNVVAGAGRDGPVGMPVGVERGAAGEDVFELALPSVAALVGGQAVEHGAVGRLLQVQIERGVDAQAGLVHLFGAEALFQLLGAPLPGTTAPPSPRAARCAGPAERCAPARPGRG